MKKSTWICKRLTLSNKKKVLKHWPLSLNKIPLSCRSWLRLISARSSRTRLRNSSLKRSSMRSRTTHQVSETKSRRNHGSLSTTWSSQINQNWPSKSKMGWQVKLPYWISKKSSETKKILRLSKRGTWKKKINFLMSTSWLSTNSDWIKSAISQRSWTAKKHLKRNSQEFKT